MDRALDGWATNKISTVSSIEPTILVHHLIYLAFPVLSRKEIADTGGDSQPLSYLCNMEPCYDSAYGTSTVGRTWRSALPSFTRGGGDHGVNPQTSYDTCFPFG